VAGRNMQFGLTRPARLLKDFLRLTKISRGGSNDRPFADQQFSSRPKRRAYVVLTNELRRVIGRR
jgi:hypothetical protein